MSFSARSIAAAVILASCSPAVAQAPPSIKTVCVWRDTAQANPPSFQLSRDDSGAFSARVRYDLQVDVDGAGLFSQYGNQSLGMKIQGPVTGGSPKLALVSFGPRMMINDGRSRPFKSLRVAISSGPLKLGPYPIGGYAYQAGQYVVSLHTTEIDPDISPLKPSEAKALLAQLETRAPVLVTVSQDGAEIGRLTFDSAPVEPVLRDARIWILANAAAYAAKGRCADPKYDVKG